MYRRGLRPYVPRRYKIISGNHRNKAMDIAEKQAFIEEERSVSRSLSKGIVPPLVRMEYGRGVRMPKDFSWRELVDPRTDDARWDTEYAMALLIDCRKEHPERDVRRTIK